VILLCSVSEAPVKFDCAFLNLFYLYSMNEIGLLSLRLFKCSVFKDYLSFSR